MVFHSYFHINFRFDVWRLVCKRIKMNVKNGECNFVKKKLFVMNVMNNNSVPTNYEIKWGDFCKYQILIVCSDFLE